MSFFKYYTNLLGKESEFVFITPDGKLYQIDCELLVVVQMLCNIKRKTPVSVCLTGFFIF